MQKYSVFIVFAFLMLVTLSFPVDAVSVGVNRAELGFYNVLRDGYAEIPFVVSTDSPQEIGGILEVEGDIVDWIRFIPENASTTGFGFSASSPRQIIAIIEPPSDAANGQYEGSIRVLTGQLSVSGDGQFGTSTRAAFKIKTLVGVTDVENSRCLLGGVRFISTEIAQPIDVSYRIQNLGNIREQPEISAIIYDKEQENVIKEMTFEAQEYTLPTQTQTLTQQLANTLEPGQYWARVESDECQGGGTVTFDVLERGGVADNGEFIRIDMESFATVGEIVPITAVFRNTGTRTVSAKFKGSVMQGKRVVKIIDTDFYDTPVNQVAQIETFFNPDAPGQYEVTGRILYNNKLTFPRTAILNVSGTAIAKNNFTPILVVVIIILLLLILIRKKKKRRQFG